MTDLNKHNNASSIHDIPSAAAREPAIGPASDSSRTVHAIDGLMSTGDGLDHAEPRIVTMPARPAEPRHPAQPHPAQPEHDAEHAPHRTPHAPPIPEAEETPADPARKKKVITKKKAVTKKVAKRSAADTDDHDTAHPDDNPPVQADADRAGSREIDGPPVKNRLVINYVPGEECRVAVVYDDRLEELHAEKAGANTIVGNIYVGKVTNVEASIQASFVDFGHGANGFLHISDLHPQYFPGADDEETERIGKKTPRRERPPIQRCLKRGQEIFVQVIKEGISTKGPTLTSYLSIPGRYVVMLPFMDKVGVSRKVEDDDERKALRQVLDQIELPKGFGFIGRTAGIGKNKTEIKRDLAYLQRLWKDIERRHKAGRGPRLLYAESDLLMRVLRDVWTNEIEEIVIDNESAVKRADRFLKIMAPRTDTRLAFYNEPRPIFHAFGLEKQIEQVFARQVPLPSGGYLVFDEAEALIAIDVNSGKSRSAGDAESNAFNTNREAVEEICRQLKLRDVGGLVLLDLIDMMHRSNRREIERLMAERLKRDRAATRFLPISDFGIMEMTRQRFRGSLKSMHFTTCPTCSGRGHVRMPTSLANGLLRTVANLFAYDNVARARAEVSPRVATELLTHKRHQIARLEHTSGKKIDIIVSHEMGVDHVALTIYDEKGGQVELDRLPMPAPPRRLEAWGGGLRPSDDWSVDASDEREAARREAMAIIAAEAALPEEPTNDPLLSDDLLSDEIVDEALGEEAQNATLAGETRRPRTRQAPTDRDEQDATRKKRRRRRRGRRDADDDGTRDDAPEQRDRTDANPRKHPAPNADNTPHADGDAPARKRRRRRRRGGRRDDAQAPAEQSGPPRQSTAAGTNEPSQTPLRKRIVVKKVIRRVASDQTPVQNHPATKPATPKPPIQKPVARKPASEKPATEKPNAKRETAATTAPTVVRKVIKKRKSPPPSAAASGSAPAPTQSEVASAKTRKKMIKRVATKVSPTRSDTPPPAPLGSAKPKPPAKPASKKRGTKKEPAGDTAVAGTPRPASGASGQSAKTTPKKKPAKKKAKTSGAG